ncbi:RNA-binding protein, putative [Trypanosoma brucei brucei TREU927]|uniref:RNA-binding protein, putative n=1 Tax=Trypanosoma brucei brucei (strain 927/4 GUTat10.1) TaxID=185431 RepID=Q57WD2_TRYB2|nr:RNA-binding protein, putative [Trypanosoma brucei brucei TREU927]AAX70101.1 RNA-binding protein, putative [Trypanosoma brucei]AAZ10429.1 RNA-binding protein, putative [Trypanosoma brucei brucei TREU927]
MMPCKSFPPSSKLLRHRSSELYSRDNLFMCNLSAAVDEAVLKQIFSPYGEILSAAVMRNIHTGDSLGTAFVRFATTEQARAALVGCHGRVVCGRVLSVQWAKRQHDGTPVGEARKKIVKLFIRNIPLDVGPEDVQRLFERFGTVESVSLHKDTAAATPTTDNSRPQRRIAFVTFTESGVADRAAEAVHNTRPFPSHGSVPLMVKLAEDHSERRLAAAAAVAGGGSGHNSSSFCVPQPRFVGRQQPKVLRPPSGERLPVQPLCVLGSKGSGPSPILRSPNIVAATRVDDFMDIAVGRWKMPEPLSTTINTCCTVMPQAPVGTNGKFFTVSGSGLCAASRSAISCSICESKKGMRYTHEPYRSVVCNPTGIPVPPSPVD